MGDSLPKGPWPKKASHQPRVPPRITWITHYEKFHEEMGGRVCGI